jgi:hypothetical protein
MTVNCQKEQAKFIPPESLRRAKSRRPAAMSLSSTFGRRRRTHPFHAKHFWQAAHAQPIQNG